MGTLLRRTVVLLALLGPWSALARAADTRGTDELETTAIKVLKAVEAKDDVPVGHVARGLDPDPWLVADVLVMGGHRTAALALAEAMPAPYGDGLRRWLEDGRPAAPAVFTAFQEVRLAMCVKAYAKAEARARAAEPSLGDDPTSLALRYERARALAGLTRHDAAARAAADVAAVAEGFGWWRQAALGRHFEALETLLVSPVRSAQSWRDLERVARASRDEGLRATALEGLATARERSRDVLGAVDAIEAAVELRAQVGEPGPWARAEAKRGALLLASGRKAEARTALEAAVRRAEAADDGATLVTALAGLGMLHLVESNAGAAVPLLVRAADAARRLDANEQAARVLVNLATARRVLGETSAALKDMQVAEELFARVGDQQGRVRALVTTALLKADIGDVAGALRAGNQALALAQASGDTEGEMLTCRQLACNLVAAGDEEASEDLLARCRVLPGAPDDGGLATERRLGSVRTAADARAALNDLAPLLASARGRKDRHSVARYLLHSAALLFVSGQLAAAEAAYTEAEAAATALGDQRLVAASQAGIASVFLADKRYDAALAWARGAASHVERMVRGLADEEGAFARAVWRDVYVIGATAAAALDKLDREYWFNEAGRAGALLEALDAREVSRGLAVPQALVDRADAARAAHALAAATVGRLLAANADRKLVADAERAREEAAARLRDADDAIDRRKKEAQAFFPQPADLATVQSHLEPGEVLVTYRMSAGLASAIVVTGKDARRVKLGTVEEVRAAVAFDPAYDGRDAAAAITRARRAVIEPLGLSPHARRLVIVPDGELAYVPFGALLPDVDVALAPSATLYARLRPRAAMTGRDVLALGDPIYGQPSVGGLPGPRMAALPGTGVEAETFGDVRLLRERATAEGLFAALARARRWRAVHLGCHGMIDRAHPSMSALYVTATPTHDGRIRAADLLRATIDADVVVLSACDTARGPVVRAEGVMGLARAAMHAGATRVIASLWKVDDAATQRLMTEFHARLKDGVVPARALREAQAVVRAEPRWAHPSFWAAWVLWGLPQ
ncbi:MAG: CHAT domain-containing protein [Planctomycetia bacterium]|nr:CHAT domain-containing protein [Planctomycetia bacterium]